MEITEVACPLAMEVQGWLVLNREQPRPPQSGAKHLPKYGTAADEIDLFRNYCDTSFLCRLSNISIISPGLMPVK